MWTKIGMIAVPGEVTPVSAAHGSMRRYSIGDPLTARIDDDEVENLIQGTATVQIGDKVGRSSAALRLRDGVADPEIDGFDGPPGMLRQSPRKCAGVLLHITQEGVARPDDLPAA